MSDFATFEIAATPIPQQSKIVVNGEDVSTRLAGYRLEGIVGGVTTLSLFLTAVAGTIEGQGVVQVVADGQDQRQAVAEFLANLDGEELQRSALERMSWGNDSGLGESMLAVLREMVAEPAHAVS